MYIRYIPGSWSASTSPARSPSPTHYDGQVPRSRRPELPYPNYGTTSLCQRSRSPSPARLQEMRERDRFGYRIEIGTSYIVQSNHFYQFDFQFSGPFDHHWSSFLSVVWGEEIFLISSIINRPNQFKLIFLLSSAKLAWCSTLFSFILRIIWNVASKMAFLQHHGIWHHLD